MNTTMCSTSSIVPVRELAGIANALRIDSGNAANAAAAPADDATVCRNRRRLFEVIGYHLLRGERIARLDALGVIRWLIAVATLVAVAGRIAQHGSNLLAVSCEACFHALHSAVRCGGGTRCSGAC